MCEVGHHDHSPGLRFKSWCLGPPYSVSSVDSRYTHSAVLFQYHRSIHILSAAAVDGTAQAHWVARGFTTIKTSHGVSTRKYTGTLYVSPFTRFLYTRRFAGTYPPRITRVAGNSLLWIRSYGPALFPLPAVVGI